MNKQEFMAMSLSKGLKGVIYIGGEQEIVTLKSIDTDGNEIWVSSDNWVYSSLNYDIKIICRKLSDLTKEIEHGGEKFVPIRLLRGHGSIEFKCSFIFNNSISIYEVNFWIIQKLIEWKFDIAGLIEKGEAIDVNTLEENPYK